MREGSSPFPGIVNRGAIYETGGKSKHPNVMTLRCADPEQPSGRIWLGIRHACFSNSLIKENREFVAAFPSEDLLYETDRVVSGRDEDQFAIYKLATASAPVVTPPLLAACRLNIECRVVDVV